ncbi:hypothetical protein [Nonomuraea sp. NPDC049480]|uniref:hypothetical protein n=1 Tax=Nonomuraea sp. NPDC049480 TaxID=3364353 RepID=UPI0037B55D6B
MGWTVPWYSSYGSEFNHASTSPATSPSRRSSTTAATSRTPGHGRRRHWRRPRPQRLPPRRGRRNRRPG